MKATGRLTGIRIIRSLLWHSLQRLGNFGRLRKSILIAEKSKTTYACGASVYLVGAQVFALDVWDAVDLAKNLMLRAFSALPGAAIAFAFEGAMVGFSAHDREW